jgi:hypothetical protein|tara:strand:+ start:2363 stop:2554 length:192 start_codon:yes stop_codon:yes gene_type:complete
MQNKTYSYSKDSHDLLNATLAEMVTAYGHSNAYAKMLGYLLVNIDLETAQRIAKHESDKKVVA